MGTANAAGGSGGKQQRVKKAHFETSKKKEVGVSDLTLISKITNEAINENLKKRFDNKEIYVCRSDIAGTGIVVCGGGADPRDRLISDMCSSRSILFAT